MVISGRWSDEFFPPRSSNEQTATIGGDPMWNIVLEFLAFVSALMAQYGVERTR
jgi:hypothetical protein